jgi:phosphoribosylglycinamide formyltransferase 1
MDKETSRIGRNLGVLVSGRGSNLQALLDAASGGVLGASVSVVVSDREDAPALDRARSAGVEAVFIDPGSKRARLSQEVEQAITDCLRGHGVDLVVLAGFFRIVGPVLLTAFPDRVINIHPSLLPSFPGLHAQRAALEYGVAMSGCTVHLVREEVDAGPILLQAAVPVEASDDEESLSARILKEEHRLLVEAIRRATTRGFHVQGRVVRWNEPSST